MQRDIENDLRDWKNQPDRMPLLLRGARQVGKTFVIKKFAESHFENCVTINFELSPEMARCFDDLAPKTILTNIALVTQQVINPGKTLLFLDEIQECPNAIRALRYFKEQMPALHVIGAGSLLDFTLNQADFRMPVGRVQFLFLKPLSFKEYLTALGRRELRQWIEQIDTKFSIQEVVHQQLLKLVREYMVLGGMPAVLQHWITTHDIESSQRIQTHLLNTYRLDFGKYASKTEYKSLQRLFDKLPRCIAENIKYVNLDGEMRSRDVKHALDIFQFAGLIYPIYHSAASGLPLAAQINEKKFKLLLLDIGLLTRANQLGFADLFNQDILLINRGIMAEQFVGQECLAYAPRYDQDALYYWRREERSSQAEVDFLTTAGSKIVPIEVKSGTTGRLKSLKLFMAEKNVVIGVRISQHLPSFHDNILSLPIYMVGEIGRLVTTF